MPTTSRRQLPPLELHDLCTRKNIEDLGSVITTEARGENETSQIAVGWTVVNRMQKDHLTQVADVWDQYAHGYLSTGPLAQLAKDILDGRIKDITNGATHFYTPIRMPKAGESTAHRDVKGGLETVAGVIINGKQVQNYRPGWAQGKFSIHISGILEKNFKFYDLR